MKPTKYGTRGNFDGSVASHPLYFRWMNMLRRCYEPKFHGYNSYGGRGVTVEPYLQVFSNYVSFVSSLPNYDKLVESPIEWQIDKDENGGNVYSRKTIQIVPAEKNLELENSRKRMPIHRIMPDGSKEYFASISEAERITGIWRGNIARAVKTGFSAGGYKWSYTL